MKNKKLSIGLKAAMAILTVTLLATDTHAATEKLLYSFDANNKGGKDPYTALISDTAGNLYGTTLLGGAFGYGAVFEVVKPPGGGGWTQKILHSFDNNGKDGYRPYAGLVFDGNGNLYGTTNQGGTHNGGTVFELSPRTGGGWTEKILHSFNNNGADGYDPYAGLVLDGLGNLYGTTPFGGANSGGTVFELTLTHEGWTENILYSFNPNSQDAYEPFAGLIFDDSGNLYGTTVDGGALGGGTVFELILTGETWAENILHNFNANDGTPYTPYAGLVFDGHGNLYGTTLNGGAGYGAVFELLVPTEDGWTEKTLHSFLDNGKDGNTPYGGVILDTAGNLYGDTTNGGSDGKGVVFELAKPNGGGPWSEKLLHTFNANERGTDGEDPQASLFLYGGNLYGTTSLAGHRGGGTVFEIVP
jgi:uncharacterized repeat protein (TIGR03803 family)